jgi:Lrp/AsnC family leucine-responsive transcriptional regulator
MREDLDDLDRQLIAALRRNARLTNLELSEIVPLSHSAISRRIKRLEETGVILGYRAIVDRSALGEGIRAFAAVDRQPHVSAVDLARSLAGLDQVVGCWIVSGRSDVVVEVTARDIADFSAFMVGTVQHLEGIAATSSTFILEEVKAAH